MDHVVSCCQNLFSLFEQFLEQNVVCLLLNCGVV